MTFKFIEHRLIKSETGVQKRFYPDNAEKIDYTKFSKSGLKPSVFCPGLEVEDLTQRATVCPSCKIELPHLSHSDYCKCGVCDLEMQRYGINLYVWRQV